MDNKPFGGKAYNSLSYFLKQKFGEKIYRVSIDAGFSCPNRDGTKGVGGCIYCNEKGARAGYVNPDVDVKEQIRRGMEIIRGRYKAKKFIAYFQAYSNTYAPVEKLREIYAPALEFPEIAGISIGTRPDCIDNEKLNLIEEIAQRKYTIIEYGVQSMKKTSLETISRAHGVDDTIRAINDTKKRKNIDILAHLIFGLPGETKDDMTETVRILVELGVTAFKFHHLYIEKGTALEKLYNCGLYSPLGLDEYTDILSEVISIIPPRVVIHRLFGQCDRENLIAPLWTIDKQRLITEFELELEKRGITQGCRFKKT
jgi:hypothetical protein